MNEEKFTLPPACIGEKVVVYNTRESPITVYQQYKEIIILKYGEFYVAKEGEE